MYNRTGFSALVAIIGFIAVADLGVAYAQIEGAVQYPPPSIGKDAHPPPPAGMVPKIVSPAAARIGHQRVEPAAYRPSLSDPARRRSAP